MVFIDLNVNFFDQENVMSFIVVIRHKSCRFTAWVIKLALTLKLYILVRSAVKNGLSLEQILWRIKNSKEEISNIFLCVSAVNSTPVCFTRHSRSINQKALGAERG